MNWKKIDIVAVLNVLREIDKQTLSISPKQSIVYSDGFEELTISYKRIKETSALHSNTKREDKE